MAFGPKHVERLYLWGAELAIPGHLQGQQTTAHCGHHILGGKESLFPLAVECEVGPVAELKGSTFLVRHKLFFFSAKARGSELPSSKVSDG